MEIALTYDPRWRYTPQGHSPFWASLDTVEYVRVLLEELGMTVLPLKADDAFETRLADIKHKYGLDKPLVVQYFDWMGGVLRGDLGKSIHTNWEVSDVIIRRMPITLHLSILAFIVSICIGVPAVLGVSFTVRVPVNPF